MSAEPPLDAIKQIYARVTHDMYSKIEETGRSKQAVVTDALELYFDGRSEPASSIDSAVAMSQLDIKDTQLAEKDAQIAASATQIAELHILLQTSISNPPKLLPPSPREHWWQFWREPR